MHPPHPHARRHRGAQKLKLGLKSFDIALDRAERLGALRVAGAEIAQALAKGDVNIGRDRRAGVQRAKR